MFTFLVVTAWTLVTIAAVFLLLLASIPFIGNVIFTNQFMLKVVIWLTNQPFAIPFFKVQTVAGPTAQYGDLVAQGGFNPWVITPVGIMNAAVPDAQKEYAMTAVPVYTLASIFTAIAILFIAVAISELVRLRKKQKISKPFVKILLIVFTVIGLLYGQTIVLISSGLLLTALILLEGVMLDPEAVNNYAEERNLITIYHEEKRFEKEVTKEGKLIGNIDLVLVRKEVNLQNQNEKTKPNSNSMLPEGSTKWKLKHELLLEKITKLQEQELLLTSANHGLSKADYLLEIQSYNERVTEVNVSIDVLGLKDMSKMPYWEERPNETVQSVSDEDLKKLYASKPYRKWKARYDTLAIKKVELEINRTSDAKYSKKVSKFNSECDSLNRIAIELGLNKENLIHPILLSETENTADASDLNQDQKTYNDELITSEVLEPVEETLAEEPFSGSLRDAATLLGSKASHNFANEQVETAIVDDSVSENNVHSYNETITTNFETTTKDTISSENIDIVDDTEVVLNSFNIPNQSLTLNNSIKSTVISETPEVNKKSDSTLTNTKTHVNEDLNILETVAGENTSSVQAIYDDLGYKQNQISLQTPPKKVETNEPTQSSSAFDFTKLPTFVDEQVIEEFETEHDESEITMTREEVESEVKNRLELAINMDLADLSTTDQLVNADINSIYKDINFSQNNFLTERKASAEPIVEEDESEISNTTSSISMLPFAFNDNAQSSVPLTSEQPVVEPTVITPPAFMTQATTTKSETLSVPTPFVESPSVGDSLDTACAPWHQHLDEKVSQLESKMSHIEETIELWTSKTSTFIKDEFDSLTLKVEKVANVVEEIKNVNSPATIIDKLSKKHVYNQK